MGITQAPKDGWFNLITWGMITPDFYPSSNRTRGPSTLAHTSGS